MKNDETYREAFEKHRSHEYLRAELKLTQFSSTTRTFVTESKKDVAELVVLGKIEDPSAILETFDLLGKMALDLGRKGAFNNEQKPPWEREQ